MQNADWIALFRQVPEEVHPSILLVLNNRTEISVETIFRIDPAYLIFRGRLSGTTDGGLPFLVPYDQLSAIYMYRQIKENEIATIFGSPVAPLAPSAQAIARRSASGTADKPVAPRPSAQGLPFGRPPEATAVARNNLLERLRAARQAAMPQPPNGKS